MALVTNSGNSVAAFNTVNVHGRPATARPFIGGSSSSSISTRLYQSTMTAVTALDEVVSAGTSGTTIGDTKGAVLRLQDVAISRGATPLLRDINWSVQANQRWGIVGPNGAGKSTLLGAITGTVRMDNGSALVGPKVRVGYLKQSAVSGSTKTVGEEARSEMAFIEMARARLEAASRVVEEGDYTDAAL